MNKIVTVEFINNNYLKYGDQYKTLFNQKHYFKYNGKTKIRDLFNELMSKVSDDPFYHTDFHLQHSFRVDLDDLILKVQLDYNIKKFLEINNIDFIKLYFNFSGLGAGAYMEIASIRINHERGRHLKTPHVHVYKGKYKKDKPYVRIRLEDFTQMKNDSTKISELFNKKEEKIIIDCLKNKDNNNKLLYYYNAVQRGIYIDSMYIYFDGKQFLFK